MSAIDLPQHPREPKSMPAPYDNKTEFGITVAVCCHNSSSRLPQTLKFIADQTLTEIPWEVLLIDNASTDNTSQIAKSLWPADSKIPFRTIHEPQLGLSRARAKAIAQSKFPIINFVDDDNWLAPDWLATAAKIMERNPKIGACGGQIVAATECAPPFWFEKYQWMYAVTQETDESGDITESRGFVAGAGLILRKDAWNDIVNLGFSNLLTGRAGGALTSGEDSEICAALKLAGWRLWNDPDLKMKHYIDRRRLSWNYLCRLSYGFGASWTLVDLYFGALGIYGYRLSGIRATRIWKLGGTIRKLFRHPTALLRAALGRGEGDKHCLGIHYCCGRLAGLIRWTSREEVFWDFLAACQGRSELRTQSASSYVNANQQR